MATKLQIKDKYGVVIGDALAAVNVLVQNAARSKVTTAAPGDLTDDSTGTDNSAYTPVFTAERFEHVGSATDLAPKTGFDTAINKVDDAIGVLAENINLYLAALGLDEITLNGTGTIATSGTIPACDKALNGVAGSSANAADRLTANTAITVARNNFATLVKAYNQVATGTGYTTKKDLSGGNASSTLVLADQTETSAGINNENNAAISDADADAALLSLVDNIATLANDVGELKTAMATSLVVNVVA